MKGLISPWPVRSLRIAPTPLQQPLLGGSPEMDLEPGQGPGLGSFRSARQGWWCFFLLTPVPSYAPLPPLCTSCSFTLFSLSLPPTRPIVFSRVGVQRNGRWGGLSGFWPHSGHLVSSATSLPCFPPLGVGTSRDFLHQGRCPTSGHGLPGSPKARRLQEDMETGCCPREAVGRCCLSQRSFQIPGHFLRHAPLTEPLSP